MTLPVRMFLQNIYFLNNKPENFALKRVKSAKMYGITFVFPNLVLTCGPEIQHIITQELWESLGKHMLADTCMQA